MSPSTALPFNAIPGPTMLENIVRFTRGGFRDFAVFLERNFKRHGPIFKYVMPGVKVVPTFVIHQTADTYSLQHLTIAKRVFH